MRIKGGPFDGVEATIVCSPGAGMREIVVCVDDWLWVPLMHIAPGQYEVISFGRQGKRAYAGLDNERIHSGLHDALCRRRRGADVMRHDRDLAEEAVRNYASLTLDTDVMRVKQQSLLLMAIPYWDTLPTACASSRRQNHRSRKSRPTSRAPCFSSPSTVAPAPLFTEHLRTP